MEKEQIIKALECCNDDGDCSVCPYERARFEDELWCTEEMHADALALIKYQELRLKQERKNNEAQAEAIKRLRDKIKDVQADTVREMQERLLRINQHLIITPREIEQVAKDMLAERKEEN